MAKILYVIILYVQQSPKKNNSKYKISGQEKQLFTFFSKHHPLMT